MENEDTGIYCRNGSTSLVPLTAENAQEFCDQWDTAFSRYLEDCENAARSILKEYEVARGSAGSVTLATRQGTLTVKLPREGDLAHLSAEQRWESDRILDAAELLRAVLCVSRCQGDTRLAHAIRLGQIAERLRIREFEPLVAIGKKRKRVGRVAGAAKNKRYRTERSRYQGVVDTYVAQGHSYNRACQLAADDANEKFFASADTIKEHTLNKQPMNRGPKKR